MSQSMQKTIAVVGGGFAGTVAARNLSAAGFEVHLFEARDRLGGRTWTDWDSAFGRKLEIGGTHVHWSQPHLWAEISRYALEVVRIRPPEHASWLAGDKLNHGTVAEASALLDGAVGKTLAGSTEAFPLPYSPLHDQKTVEEFDKISIASVIENLALSNEEHVLLDAMWSLNFCGPAENGSAAKALHLGSLVNGNPQDLMAALDDYKLKDGTGELISRIVREHPVHVRLGTEVGSIDSTGTKVQVESSSGIEEYDGVVVAVPGSLLPTIKFEAPLPSVLEALGTRGQISAGFKVWAKARVTDPRGWFGAASRPHRITLARIEDDLGDGTVLIRGFGVDATGFDLNDRGQVQEAFRELIPDIEVIECRGHNWIEDSYALETWPFPAVGEMVSALTYENAPGAKVVFAGTALAHGWGGYIDGAIETGVRAAQSLTETLGTATAVAAPTITTTGGK